MFKILASRSLRKPYNPMRKRVLGHPFHWCTFFTTWNIFQPFSNLQVLSTDFSNHLKMIQCHAVSFSIIELDDLLLFVSEYCLRYDCTWLTVGPFSSIQVFLAFPFIPFQLRSFVMKDISLINRMTGSFTITRFHSKKWFVSSRNNSTSMITIR